ncbi:DivIVA domain-containing protein [Ornithinimicrobium sp. W1665]|uniref:DivIVA domain-containing protein n=1 Tax=Ornithinimicrobium sp. W1665 TaxID=3416666 RepID=UPI003CE7D48D
MLLSPEDVVRKTFNTVVLRRGYDADEVDAFLEEVVQELRRLHGRVDELEAEAIRRHHTDETGHESERLRMEKQQLELVRRERAELVEELRSLQAQVEAGPQGAPGGESLEPQRDDLQRQVAELRAELDRLHQHHHEFSEHLIESVREHLHLLEAGHDQLPPHGTVLNPPVR